MNHNFSTETKIQGKQNIMNWSCQSKLMFTVKVKEKERKNHTKFF